MNGIGFKPEAIHYTAPTVYRATVAMNAAQAYHITDLYGISELTRPFDQHGFGEFGRQLARMVLETDAGSVDEGHRSDMQIVDEWARELHPDGMMGVADQMKGEYSDTR